MKLRIALVALPLAIAGCNKTPDTTTNQAVPAAAPVAAAPAPAGQKWVDVVSKTTDGGMLMGNPNAPLKLVEYGSRTCPHCAKFDQEDFPHLQSDYIASGKVSYEFRDFPVHDVLDMAPIILGRCVDPAAFFPMLDQMMANQQTLLANTSKIDNNALQGKSPSQQTAILAQQLGYLDFVKQRGLTADKAQACLADPKAYDAIAQQTAKASSDYSINSTPTFILNGKVITTPLGEEPWDSVKRALKASGA
jgi:protein-disulfide isomerase